MPVPFAAVLKPVAVNPGLVKFKFPFKLNGVPAVKVIGARVPDVAVFES